MVRLTDEELKAVEKYCGSNYVQRYRAILKRDQGDIVKVVNTGMVSSGKSSLFNIFIDSALEEHFPTGAARTTTLADSYDYKNISFIDTPGIDVRSEDDDLAFRTIMEADLILMVHNIKTGPLNRSESEWLETICAGMKDADMRRARLIFVCTWKDTREKDADYPQILANVKDMVFQIAGTEIPFFDVSTKKFKTGITKNVQSLQENSGILQLREYLESYAAGYLENKKKMDHEELKLLASEMKAAFLQQKERKNTEKQKISRRVEERYKSNWGAWHSVFDYFSSIKKQLGDLQKELDELQGIHGMAFYMKEFFGK